MAVSFSKFQSFVQNLGRKVFNLNADTLKLALSNTAPNAATANQLSDITQISAANGYTSGGTTVAGTAYSQSGGTATLIGNAVTFTASGGSMGAFRYVVLYDDTATNKELIGYWDYGSSITLNSGDSAVIKPSGSTTGGSILTIS